jgi:hypothetical protein
MIKFNASPLRNQTNLKPAPTSTSVNHSGEGGGMEPIASRRSLDLPSIANHNKSVIKGGRDMSVQP